MEQAEVGNQTDVGNKKSVEVTVPLEQIQHRIWNYLPLVQDITKVSAIQGSVDNSKPYNLAIGIVAVLEETMIGSDSRTTNGIRGWKFANVSEEERDTNLGVGSEI